MHAISEMSKIAMLLKKDEVEIRVKTYDAQRRKKSWANKMHVD